VIALDFGLFWRYYWQIEAMMDVPEIDARTLKQKLAENNTCLLLGGG
jgi:hypothetical protein